MHPMPATRSGLLVRRRACPTPVLTDSLVSLPDASDPNQHEGAWPTAQLHGLHACAPVLDLTMPEAREGTGRHEYDGQIQDLSPAGVLPAWPGSADRPSTMPTTRRT